KFNTFPKIHAPCFRLDPFFPIDAKREATPLPFAPYTVLPYTYKIKLRAADFFLAILGIFSDFRPEICNFAAGIINP
ncbi:MAG TPA: hypothetical protein PLN34_06565, partial [Alloprevotella sp.]|nr:hypothetical protein [Alloprevotella sp.]